MIETINTVNKKVSKKLNKDIDLVKKINAFYFKEVHKAIASGEYNGIRLKHIGTLHISKFKLYSKIKEAIKEIRLLKNPNKILKRPKEEVLEIKYAALRILLERRNELAKNYKENDENLHNKLSKKDLAE